MAKKKAEKETVNYSVDEKSEPKYYTVGKLREVLKNLGDEIPVVAAPLNDKIRVALDISIAKDAMLGEYKGDVAIFSTGLFDIATGKEINLVPNE